MLGYFRQTKVGREPTERRSERLTAKALNQRYTVTVAATAAEPSPVRAFAKKTEAVAAAAEGARPPFFLEVNLRDSGRFGNFSPSPFRRSLDAGSLILSVEHERPPKTALKFGQP